MYKDSINPHCIPILSHYIPPILAAFTGKIPPVSLGLALQNLRTSPDLFGHGPLSCHHENHGIYGGFMGFLWDVKWWFYGIFMGFYGGLMGFNGGFMGFLWDFMVV